MTQDERKKIMFYDTPDRQIRLRTRCQHDGITQSQFFRFMVSGYIENDPQIIEYLNNCKIKFNLQGSQKRKKIIDSHARAEENKTKFALDDKEIESIFDIIELGSEL